MNFKPDSFIEQINSDNNYRYERKFIIPDYYSVQEIEHHIKSNSALFREIFHQRKINNIYFDTHDFESYLDNIHGISYRKKIRIRWYGETFGEIVNPILEIKTKNGLLGDKLSYKMGSFILDNEFTKEYIQTIFKRSEIPKPIFESLHVVIPTLLNTYQRKYYLSADKKFRITLDFNLQYHNMDIRFNNFKTTPQKDSFKIIELKYNPLHDSDSKKITSQFSFRLHKNSKYVNGIYLQKQFPQ